MSTEAEGMDTFNSPVVHDTQTSIDINSQEDSGDVDTFDNPGVVELPEDNSAKEGEESGTKDEKAKDELEGQTDKLPEQHDKDKKPEEKTSKPEGKDEEGDDKAPEEAGDDKSEDSGDKPKGKTIRIKEGDSKYDLSADATIPVKVKGKKEFVSLDELRSNYSGNKVWGEEIEQVRSDKVEHEKDVVAFNQAREDTKAEFAKIGDLIDKGYNDPEADPLGAMKYLLELGGRDVLQFEKKMVDHYSQIAYQFDEMDEAEKNLYWTQRENEILKNNQASQTRTNEARTATEQRGQQLATVREKYGVSESDYKATETELMDLGYTAEEITPEQISHYAALKEPIAQAEELCNQFEEDLSDEEMDALVAGTGDTLYKHPHLSDIEALRFSAKKLGYELETEDDLVSQLEEKLVKPRTVIDSSDADKYRAVKLQENNVESFDDFDEMTYARS